MLASRYWAIDSAIPAQLKRRGAHPRVRLNRMLALTCLANVSPASDNMTRGAPRNMVAKAISKTYLVDQTRIHDDDSPVVHVHGSNQRCVGVGSGSAVATATRYRPPLSARRRAIVTAPRRTRGQTKHGLFWQPYRPPRAQSLDPTAVG